MNYRRRKPKVLQYVLIFLAVVALTVACFSFIRSYNIRRIHDIVYADSLTEAEKISLEAAVNPEQKYAAPIHLSSQYALTTSTSDIVLDVLVPVTDWYSQDESISAEEALRLNESQGTTTYLASISQLDGTQKILSIDDDYFLDDPSRGGVYKVLKIEPKSTDENCTGGCAERLQIAIDEDVTALREQLQTWSYQTPSSDQILTFAQTGVTALSRAMITELDRIGGDGAYFAKNIQDFLSSKDLTHISNEVSFADDCRGGRSTVVLCADWRMLNTIKAIGTDIVELTGNHNNDYGIDANLNTIVKYEELGLKTFGGGKDEASASVPLQLNQKQAKITLLGYNNSTTTAQYGGANGSTPGANLYQESLVRQQISEAKARGDFVIVDLQYFECYCYPDGYVEYTACDSANNPAGQQAFFRHLVDLGADMVVGTQAHQPQTFELYQGKPIYYGLGNLFFDQTYWPGTTRGLVLTHYFLGGKYVQTRISPTVYGDTYQTRLMDSAEAQDFLARLLASSPRGE